MKPCEMNKSTAILFMDSVGRRVGGGKLINAVDAAWWYPNDAEASSAFTPD